jgi:hypothetical protein
MLSDIPNDYSTRQSDLLAPGSENPKIRKSDWPYSNNRPQSYSYSLLTVHNGLYSSKTASILVRYFYTLLSVFFANAP